MRGFHRVVNRSSLLCPESLVVKAPVRFVIVSYDSFPGSEKGESAVLERGEEGACPVFLPPPHRGLRFPGVPRTVFVG